MSLGISGTPLVQGKGQWVRCTKKNINATAGSRSAIAAPVVDDVVIMDPYAHDDSGVGKNSWTRPQTNFFHMPAAVVKEIGGNMPDGNGIAIFVEPIEDAEKVNVNGSVTAFDPLAVTDGSYKLVAATTRSVSHSGTVNTGTGSMSGVTSTVAVKDLLAVKAIALAANSSGDGNVRCAGLGLNRIN